ncbi:DUF4388 domain-containing protein [Thermus sp. PS18]|uniref:DUF4388 domain-containing protein n=1 Tax=Thermus sp. PS18 TaxID=2849039 RepID=UPI0022649B5A|nr:DUF4388 domain-containing protein [Thermus sp. PS18]UZX14750.1 DUF4388 domain-containing protein [Thermus sp. PS18]
MAIFGSLKDMSLPDVVGMLGRRSGVLEVFALPGRRQSFAIALEGGRVIWVKEGTKVLDPLQARSVLQELFRTQEGAFEFSAGTPSPPPEGQGLGWPLERLLLTMTTIEDEYHAYSTSLPDPKTRFRAVQTDIWLEEPLWSFWEKAKPFLSRSTGASAEELAQRLGLRDREVAYYLHKLRLAGKLAPVRAYEETLNERAPEKQGLFRRLLASLLGRTR